jgi:hypothetical protein
MTALRCHRDALEGGYCEIHQEIPVASKVKSLGVRCEAIAAKSGQQCVKMATVTVNGKKLCGLHDPAKAAMRSEITRRGAEKRYGHTAGAPKHEVRKKHNPKRKVNSHAPSKTWGVTFDLDQLMDALKPMVRDEIRAMLGKITD